MKTQLPEQLKADVPLTTWGKILTATPVVMAVVSTMLAGLASSEMTKAQYERSLAAQQQSKAGDQWSYFQAKRLRGSMQRSTLDVLQSVAPAAPVPAGIAGKMPPEVQAALLNGATPALPPVPALDENLKRALEGMEALQPDSEVLAALAQVKDETLAAALRAAQARVNSFDTLLKPLSQAIESIEQAPADASPEVRRSVIAARLRYAANRYDAEARLNQSVAILLECQVRKSNVSAERHHGRSQQFFYGMLAAQAAVIISTFSLAAKQRSILWSLAAAAGLLAIAFAVYVYLCV
jgi:hypothetical protein